MKNLSLPWKPWSELAPSLNVERSCIDHPTCPSYGRYIEDFKPGQVFAHPRGITLNQAMAQDFATTFMESCPLFLNETYPQALGFEKQLVSPLMVLATTLSLGVQNESEKAIAHLGYYDVCFPKVTYVGDTLRALTRVVDKKEKGPGEPGIVHVQTLGLNQRGEVAVRYERKIMIPSRGSAQPGTSDAHKTEFPWPESPAVLLPEFKAQAGWTSDKTFFENFNPGQIILHFNGRTITDEHLPWTYRLGNTHPLHFDSVYTHALPPPMGGDPVVYGGLVFSWIAGLASRDTTENMIWDLGYTQGYHTQPTRAGDTVYAVSRILKKEESSVSGAGILTIQLLGLKNIGPEEALKQYGASLFVKENDKKKLGLEKISSKIFEIERRVLIQKKKH